MRLDFNVLWVDDQPDRVKAQVTAIAKHMDSEGFRFCPRPCRSLEAVQAAIADHVFVDEVDLILVDWDLGNDLKGEDVLVEVRASIQYKDIVFYSAATAPETLRQAAFSKGLEGVYCSNRDDLVHEVEGVFDSLVKKVLDLDHTRGIVMGATSDIDHLVNECLVAVQGKLKAGERSAFIEKAKSLVSKRAETMVELAKTLGGASAIEQFYEHHMVLTAHDRLMMLASALKSETCKPHAGARTAVNSYMQNVVPDRNILGHVVLVPAGKPTAVTHSSGKSMSLQETRELRRLILQLRDEFRSLLTALRGAG